MLIIKEFINNIFNNPPISVEQPRPQTKHYSDVGTRIEAYIVKVTYKNGRNRRFSFAVDHDHFLLSSQERSLKRANKFYQRQCAKIKAMNQQQHENTK